MRPQDRYDSLFQHYGAARGVDWRLLKAQAMAESALDPDAISRVGAQGLAQFMKNTFEEWRDGTPGIQAPPPGDLVLLDPRDPEDAIRAQAAYMGWLLDAFGNEARAALAAYNWGIGRVRAAMGRAGNAYLTEAPQETRDYVRKVLRHLDELWGVDPDG